MHGCTWHPKDAGLTDPGNPPCEPASCSHRGERGVQERCAAARQSKGEATDRPAGLTPAPPPFPCERSLADRAWLILQQFGFGQTETKPEADIAAAFTQVLVRLSARGPVLLVFHDFPSEKYYCQQQGYSTANWIEFIPPQLYVRGSCHGAAERGFGQHYPIIVQDTQRLFGAFQPGQLGLTTALSRTCAYFRVRGTRMNNAGEGPKHHWAWLEMWPLERPG